MHWNSKRNLFKPLNMLYWLLILYLFYHATFSHKGVVTLYDLKRQIKEKKVELNNLEQKYNDFKNNISSLNADTLSLDMIEEKAKEKFNLVRENEMLFIIEN